MEIDKLTARARQDTGSSKSRALRAQARIPAVLYGHKEETLHIDVSEEEMLNVLRSGHHIVDLEHDSGVKRAVIKDIQYDTLTEKILHIDFNRVAAGEKIKVELPIRLQGTPVGANQGGILQQEMEIISVECMPENVPDEIPVRVSDLEINDSLHVSDLPEIPGLKYAADGKHVVAHVLPPRKEEVVEEITEEAPAGAEPEVLTERKETEEPAEGEKGKSKE